MSRRWSWLIVVMAVSGLWLFFPGPVQGKTPDGLSIVLDGRSRYEVGNFLHILEDPEGKLTINEVSSSEFTRRFRRIPGSVPNMGITPSVFWARFQIKNPTDQTQQPYLSFEYPVTDSVSLFLPESDGGWARLEAGDSVPNSPEVIPHRYFVFPLNLQPHQETAYYVRVRTTAAMTLPLTLWTPTAFLLADHHGQIIFGLLFGMAVGFIIYFLVTAFKLNNPSCFWFALYLTALGLLVSIREGFFQELVPPTFKPWNNLINVADIGFLYFIGAKFLRTFLDVESHSPKVDFVLALLQWMGLLYIPVLLFPTPITPLYSLLLVGLGPIFSTTVSIVYWLKGVPNAKYFAIGWLVGHFTSTIDFLRISGLIPYISLMDFAIPASLVSSLIFFTMAVVQQLYTYRLFANQDGLTGLANRRCFDQVLNSEWRRNQRHLRPLSLIMADIDFFKDYNDAYGHKAGDACLVGVAKVLQHYARRPGDLAARYGGEEFVVLLPESSAEEAEQIAERIREGTETLHLSHKSSTVKGVVTVSLGVATVIPDQNTGPDSLVQKADQALYQAKQTGRNRVICSAAA